MMDYFMSKEQFETIVKHLQSIKDQSRLINIRFSMIEDDKTKIVAAQATDIEHQVVGIDNTLCELNEVPTSTTEDF